MISWSAAREASLAELANDETDAFLAELAAAGSQAPS
jgi:hypothetical protein